MKTLLREPLLHFLVIGAALFLYNHFGAGGAGPGSTRIVVSAGQVAHLQAGFARTWSRPPSQAELKALVDEWVREEIAVREAVDAGLDRDDTVIRRRLRQKLEFLVEDEADASQPTEEELRAWLARHAEQFRSEPRIAFRQVFVNRDRRGAVAETAAASLRDRLNAADAARWPEVGDATMLPAEFALAPLAEVDRVFGAGFAKQLETLPSGRWAGPLRSGYGLHLVLVHERAEGGMPEFAALRPYALREVLAERRKQRLAATYDRLLQKYTVVVEPAALAPSATAARAP